MDRYKCDALVIGAGVVGLAVGRQFALANLETIILEKNSQFGMETSSRNSEVVHAGIYYPENSLKAKFCVRGRELLYAFCQDRGVAHKPIGKLIVATKPGETNLLDKIADAASANGVTDLERLSKSKILSLEPELMAEEGLFSPSSGIVDSHNFMLALLREAETAGAMFAKNSPVRSIARTETGYRVVVDAAGVPYSLDAKLLINSGGLWSQKIAAMIEGVDAAHVPPTYFAKGCYAILSGKSPFRHLIYPVPEPGGLGLHVTLDLGSQARFGPDVEWLETTDPARLDYAVPASVPANFVSRIAKYWPKITQEMLVPGYAGIRPKTGGRKNPMQDFQIEGPGDHGLPGLVNLFGIESPGLTSSLAIAEYTLSLLDGQLR